MFEPVTPDEHGEYLAGLNRCFVDWGGAARLAWVLRPFGGMVHEVLGLRVDGRLVAGSIVSFRLVGTAEDPQRVGIMTGSWTDPSQRGRGLFSEVISRSADVVRRAGGVALLAFVTADNASRGRLEKAGSLMVPTWYLSTPTKGGDSARSAWQEADDLESALRAVDAERARAAGAAAAFIYPEVADLAGQWLGRSPDTRVLRSTSGAIAVVEEAGSTTRLLAGPSGDFGTDNVFSFTCDRGAVVQAREQGAACTDGFLTVLRVDDGWPLPSAWLVDNGDRI